MIAANFTPAETAVLTVIAWECKRDGVCSLPIDVIAALAGVCRTSVQNTLRLARRLGHIEVTERRRPGMPSLTNLIRVISPEWANWLRLRPAGFKKSSPTNTDSHSRASNGSNFGQNRLPARTQAASKPRPKR